MHELSVAISLIEVVTETLIREKASRATSVTIEVGELSGIVPEALASAFVVATRDSALKGAELRVLPIAVAIWCETCNAERQAKGPSEIVCVECGTPSHRVVKGKELDVVEVEIEVD